MGSPLLVGERADLPADAELSAWVAALAADRPADHVIGLPEATGVPAPILAAGRNGRIRVGRYAGVLSLDGTPLVIRPRPDSALAPWVYAALGRSGGAAADDDIVSLIALIWADAVDRASRHGPPAFRREVAHSGATVRGHLDVRRTVRTRAKGGTEVASVYRVRNLDNPVTRAIVAADRVLVRQVGHRRWRTDRIAEILPQLHVAVGRRTAMPGTGELERMRYTPITRPFKWAAELSARIVRQDSVATTPRPGRAQGLVVDLADVERHAAMAWAHAAQPQLRFELQGRDEVIAIAPSGASVPLCGRGLPADAGEAAAAVREAVEALSCERSAGTLSPHRPQSNSSIVS